MPIYEYACKSCGQHLEIAQSFKDEALTTCPACGGPLRKVFGSIGIAFKGSGFYRTDSRAASANGAKPDRKEKAGADKGDKGDKTDKGGSGEKSATGSETSATKASDGSSSGGKDASKRSAKAKTASA